MRAELVAYGHGLAEKPEIVALSKIDALPPAEVTKCQKKLAKAAGRMPILVSAVSGNGVDAALRLLAREIDAAVAPDPNGIPAEEVQGWRP